MKTLYITDLDGTLLNSDAQVSSISASVIRELIDKVVVYSADRVEIRYRFENAFETMKKYVDAYSDRNYSESEAV